MRSADHSPPEKDETACEVSSQKPEPPNIKTYDRNRRDRDRDRNRSRDASRNSQKSDGGRGRSDSTNSNSGRQRGRTPQPDENGDLPYPCDLCGGYKHWKYDCPLMMWFKSRNREAPVLPKMNESHKKPEFIASLKRFMEEWDKPREWDPNDKESKNANSPVKESGNKK